jgi:beta-phosphoglucomutase
MRSLEIILELGKKNLTELEMTRLADQKNRWYIEYIERIDESELLKGAKEYITKLKEQGKKISLGSASKNALTILNRLRIADLFDCIVDGTKVTKAKPDPEVFTLGACGMGLIPSDCVVFEDAEAGIQAAKNAGMRAVGIGDRDRLNQADMVVKGLFELL